MAIKDGLGLPADENGRVEIPNCDRRQLPHFFDEMGYITGVEIGVYKAGFTKRLCNKGFKLYGIDPWLFYKEYHPKSERSQRRQEALYKESKRRLAPYPNCEIIRKFSMEAVKDFKENSIDFVYIDGHHGFKYVTEDIFEWSKKVRKGGVISGHDYDIEEPKDDEPYGRQIRFVVEAYTKAFRIKKWYVLGTEEWKSGERRDSNRSWFSFK